MRREMRVALFSGSRVKLPNEATFSRGRTSCAKRRCAREHLLAQRQLLLAGYVGARVERLQVVHQLAHEVAERQVVVPLVAGAAAGGGVGAVAAAEEVDRAV